MAYGLGVDLGTTYTAAAASGATGTRVIPLGRNVTVSSVVYAAENGVLLTGDEAEREATVNPLRASHAHKRRLADPTPRPLGGVVRSPASLMASQLRDVISTANAVKGSPPGAVVLTCPAVWGPYRREHFEEVPRLAGVRDVQIVTEPEAAAMHYSVERRLGEGEIVAVYDLGGGTFDATILRARQYGMEILGTPEGIEHLGGIDFDESLLAHLDDRLDGAVSALDPADPDHTPVLAAVREACRQAKEELSTEPDAVVHLELPDGPRDVLVTRLEFNDLIKPHLEVTTDALLRTIASAGLRPAELAGVLLAGGSSRIPLIGQTVSQTFGRPVRVSLHPKLTVALGAAAIVRAQATHTRAAAAARTQEIRTRPAPVTSMSASAAVATPAPLGGIPDHAPVATPSSGISTPMLFRPGLPPAGHRHTPPQQGKGTAIGRRRLTIAAVAAAVLLLGGVVTSAAMSSGLVNAQPRGTTQIGRTAQQSESGTNVEVTPQSYPWGLVALRDGQDVAPFHSMIGSELDWTGTSLSPGGTAAHPALSVQPGDVNGKADGRRVVWTGNGPGQFYLQHPQGRQDARPYLESGALAFDVVVVTPPAAEVDIAMHCSYPCAATLTATSVLRNVPLGQKTTIRIPLACFAAEGKGLDPANVDIPFLVYTKGTFDATFAQVRWETSGAAQATSATPCTDLR
ncbi:Hsp70 family protein [Lentzea sp. NPDC004782]|uniref:Hsp70 family protein n=1 Tax=Lentzea sp. NPDC004782 TaxID=3154458 RepID=UPI0033A8C6E3